MKTYIRYISIMLCLTGLLMVNVGSQAQDAKLDRREKKEIRKAQLTRNFYLIDSLLNVKKFVLEANYLRNRYGDRIPVTSAINFIRVDKTKGTLQTGSDYSLGYNGVGGVTAEGNVGKWKVDSDAKRMVHTLRFSLLTNLGNYDVVMIVRADAHATATITGLGPGSLTWEGYLVTLSNARIYKGHNSI